MSVPRIDRTALAPLLVVTYPVVYLLAANVGQVRLPAGIRPLLLSWVFTGLLLAFVSWRTGSLTKASLWVSVLAILFFSYGHLYEALSAWPSAEAPIGRHRILVPIYVLIVAAAVWLVNRIREPARWSSVLATVAAVLIATSAGTWAWSSVQESRAEAEAPTLEVDPVTGQPIVLAAGLGPVPDVYYIVLDAYGRSDSLNRLLGIDNRPFLEELEARGFAIASCAQPNYSFTTLSLASSLNMAYLDDLGDKFTPNRDDVRPVRALITHSLVEQLFEGLGYELIAFETGFPFTELRYADHYIAPPDPRLFDALTPFELVLLRSSAGLVLFDAYQILFPNSPRDSLSGAQRHYDRTLLALATLEAGDFGPGPQFIFAHIVSPHAPFVFGPSGRATVPPLYRNASAEFPTKMDWYRVAYADQVAYLNDRVLRIIDNILATSESEPVILLQGDHGPEQGGSSDRMAILSAYRLPGGNGVIYPKISPVNSFRVVFNQVWDSDLPLLEDKAHFSTYNRPFDYSIIDNGDCRAE